MNKGTPVHVAAGVLTDRQGRILVSRRAPDAHQGGLWEFPGGKREANESAYQALVRELHEELGIYVESARPLISIKHDYHDRCIILDVWQILRYHGEPEGQEGQPLQWLAADRLTTLNMPAADKPVINAIRLSSEYLITPHPDQDTAVFLRQLNVVLQQGIRLVQLRAPKLSEQAYAELAQQVVPLCHKHNALVLLNRRLDLVESLGADGVHISSQQLQTLSARPLAESLWVAVSCHHQEDLIRAEETGADFCVLSPVQATGSHPETSPLGWENFSRLVQDCRMPVFALGGMKRVDIVQAYRSGGQGVAAISGLWSVE
ncbi:MAG TPA: Nudix family hydrolase [Gammaproteobacteria bacterium]|nr:Nudix family hydrolase [Gammaproteobacteria bacterium]